MFISLGPLLYCSFKVKKPLLDSEDVLRFKTRQVGIYVSVRLVKTTPRSYPALLRPAEIQILPKTGINKTGRCDGLEECGKGMQPEQAAAGQEPAAAAGCLLPPRRPQPPARPAPPGALSPSSPSDRTDFVRSGKPFLSLLENASPPPVQSELLQGIGKSNELFHLLSPRGLQTLL